MTDDKKRCFMWMFKKIRRTKKPKAVKAVWLKMYKMYICSLFITSCFLFFCLSVCLRIVLAFENPRKSPFLGFRDVFQNYNF